jgi:MoaA/NifB/PqqE/SkfB family radical SAM enzyme
MTQSHYFPSIPVVFKEKFPEGYVNDVLGWGNFPLSELHNKTKDGIFELKCLDIDLGIGCTLNCPHCFKRTYNSDLTQGKMLSFNDYILIAEKAKKLGLKSIKIVGAGEPFENKEILPFLRKMTEMDIHVSIFTKGHVLGNDELAKRYFSQYGIESAKQLVSELYGLKTSILLGFNSFHKDIQGVYVGLQGKRLDDFYDNRNNALLYLCEAGFNKFIPGTATRLALIAAPFKTEYLDDILEIFEWARRRNIYTITCPTTESGDGRKEMVRVSGDKGNPFEAYRKAAIDFYVKIYNWSIENGIIKLEDFKKQGVSLYPGSHACNQTSCGMYVTYDGRVMQCPGFDNETSLVDNDVRELDIQEAWLNSPNYKRAMQANRFNYECIARTHTLHFNHENFYSVIYNKVLEQWEKAKTT